MDFLFFQHILSCICCLWLYIIPLADKLQVQQQRRGAVLFIFVVIKRVSWHVANTHSQKPTQVDAEWKNESQKNNEELKPNQQSWLLTY